VVLAVRLAVDPWVLAELPVRVDLLVQALLQLAEHLAVAREAAELLLPREVVVRLQPLHLLLVHQVQPEVQCRVSLR
jgi:hypothetical protein